MSTSQKNKNLDIFFMNLALLQAYRNLGNTKDNPSVGCVIVKDNYLISAGNTSEGGRPHAEINAINNCKQSTKDTIMYVTLEPCSNYGKTPPCVNSIVKNKIKKVYYSIKDPDLKSYNQSKKKLKKLNIQCDEGIYKNKIKDFYKSYYMKKNSLLPFVTAKMAISKDFYTINKKKKWITNEYARLRGHIIRSSHDCIVTSSKTINNDNSLLTCRINGLENKSPTRVILDAKLNISLNSNIVKTAKRYKTIIFFNTYKKNKIKKLKNNNIKLIKSNISTNENFNLKLILIKLKELGFSRILIESGINLVNSFLKNKLINEFKLFVSKDNLYNKGLNNFKSNIKIYLKRKQSYMEKVNLFGDKLISYTIK